jgi:hypothetical protein
MHARMVFGFGLVCTILSSIRFSLRHAGLKIHAICSSGYFGEGPGDRRDRLRQLLIERGMEVSHDSHDTPQQDAKKVCARV